MPRKKSAPRPGNRKSAPSVAIPIPPEVTRPRLKMPEAMRAVGLDEMKIASSVNSLLDGLQPRNAKLKLDVLKESCKLIGAYPEAGAGAGLPGGSPDVPVQLVTYAPRPVRPPESEPALEPAPEHDSSEI